ncbi:MAG: type IV toxin-antitoxin system AbiEi family antitoxin [Gammaproteobacteria bacterium]
MSQLLAQGETVFTRGEAQKALGISSGAFLDAAERQQRHKQLLSPRRGFYVIVPPQFLSWGAPPPSWYIDSLMRHEDRPYYVGLLKAAELHGASHQAVMEFQVVTDKRLPKIRAGRSSIVFYYRKDMEAVATGLDEYKTDTGKMKISSAALTALDMLRYPHASGGVEHILTVLTDLGGRVDAPKLAQLSALFERSVVQRLGHLLGRAGYAESSDALYEVLLRRGALPWVELEPVPARQREFRSGTRERDQRWRVIIRRRPEADE